MEKPVLASDAAFATVDKIQNAVNEHVDFAKNRHLQAFPDGSIYMQMFIYGGGELITAHINAQGNMTDLQTVELLDGQIGEVENQYKTDLWNDLVEQGVPVHS